MLACSAVGLGSLPAATRIVFSPLGSKVVKRHKTNCVSAASLQLNRNKDVKEVETAEEDMGMKRVCVCEGERERNS